MEIELAREARAQPGARELLERLRDRGAHLGILTRNGEQIALETLAACGLLEFFEHDAIIGPRVSRAQTGGRTACWLCSPVGMRRLTRR